MKKKQLVPVSDKISFTMATKKNLIPRHYNLTTYHHFLVFIFSFSIGFQMYYDVSSKISTFHRARIAYIGKLHWNIKQLLVLVNFNKGVSIYHTPFGKC